MSLWHWAPRLDNTTSKLTNPNPNHPLPQKVGSVSAFLHLYSKIVQSSCINVKFDPSFSDAAHDRHITIQFSRRISIQKDLHE